MLLLSSFLVFCNAEANNAHLCNTSYKDIDDFRNISFTENRKIEFSDENKTNTDSLWNKVFDYKVLEKGKISYLIISKNNVSKKFMMLHSESLLVLYDERSNLIFKGASKINTERLYFPNKITASSELKEGNTIYSANNLANLELDKCWAECKSGYGIGEHVEFKMNGQGIFIFNGYLSGKKNCLYEKNSRVKEIEVIFLNDNSSKIYKIKDTPNPQFIPFGIDYSGQVMIKFLDVYKGTKYKDMCLNSIILLH